MKYIKLYEDINFDDINYEEEYQNDIHNNLEKLENLLSHNGDYDDRFHILKIYSEDIDIIQPILKKYKYDKGIDDIIKYMIKDFPYDKEIFLFLRRNEFATISTTYKRDIDYIKNIYKKKIIDLTI